MPCAAAEGFDAHRARSSVGIEEDGSLQLRSQYIEQRFTEAVRSGSDRQTRNGFQLSAAKFTGNHPHTSTHLHVAVLTLPVLLDVADHAKHVFAIHGLGN